MSSTELDTRSRILAETWKLMEQRRGLGVRIQDIAQAAGVSRQAVYLHFPSRAELLVATTRYADQVFGSSERYQRFCAAPTGIEMLECYVDFWGNYIPRIYGLAKALMIAQETDEAAKAAWKERMNDVRESCRSVVEKLEKEGLLAPGWTTETAIDLMWTVLLIPNWENLVLNSGWSQEQYISRVKTALKRALVKLEAGFE